MLPIYKAQGFDRVLTGGRTRPWLIIVFIENQPFPYVVKLYSQKDVDTGFSVAKDVYCSILAQSFGLQTPKPALIEFTEGFIKSLPHDIREELAKKDNRIKFGCEFIDAAFQYNDTLNRASLQKYDFENIYMFDNLVLNADRRTIRPNILLKGTNAYLIDHELTFPLSESTIPMFHQNNWVYNSKGHIFYNYLKNSSIEHKKVYFEDFKAKLKVFDFNILDAFYKQMLQLGHDNAVNFDSIKSYLCVLKENSDKFAILVRAQIG